MYNPNDAASSIGVVQGTNALSMWRQKSRTIPFDQHRTADATYTHPWSTIVPSAIYMDMPDDLHDTHVAYTTAIHAKCMVLWLVLLVADGTFISGQGGCTTLRKSLTSPFS